MKNYTVTSATLKDDLKFELGQWKGKGNFRLNNAVEGNFELTFMNGFKQELFVNLYLENYSSIRSNTFYNIRKRLREELLTCINPELSQPLEIIRLKESYMVKPTVQFSEEIFIAGRYEIPFVIGSEPEKVLWVWKENGRWTYDMSTHNSYAYTIDFSNWLSYVWEQLKDFDRMSLLFLMENE